MDRLIAAYPRQRPWRISLVRTIHSVGKSSYHAALKLRKFIEPDD
jgi:hypothetical protein